MWNKEHEKEKARTRAERGREKKEALNLKIADLR